MSRSASEHELVERPSERPGDAWLFRCKCGWEAEYEEEVEAHIKHERAAELSAKRADPLGRLARAGGAAIMPTPGERDLTIEHTAEVKMPVNVRLQVRFEGEDEVSWVTAESYMEPGDTLTWKYDPRFTVD